MSRLTGPILGISDSRPPGRFLSRKEGESLLTKFDLPHDNTSEFYGLERHFVFFRRGSTHVRCYNVEYASCLTMATELQDRLSHLNVAPPVYDEMSNDQFYLVVSKLDKPVTNGQFDCMTLNSNIKQLHSALSTIMKEWRIGANEVADTYDRMRSMMIKHSEILFSSYDVDPTVIVDYERVFEEIDKKRNYGHGDMHPGNILQNGNQYVFIDFESVFHSKGAAVLDAANLTRFNVRLPKSGGLIPRDGFNVKKLVNYLLVKNAIVINFLESNGKYVSSLEREKFLGKISRR